MDLRAAGFKLNAGFGPGMLAKRKNKQTRNKWLITTYLHLPCALFNLK